MESPPSTSTLSETFILSDDSGLLLTSGSISSGSMSGESRSYCGHLPLEFHDSDCEDKSLSQADSLDGMSDIICGENFNTLKKGPHYADQIFLKPNSPIEPPPEFQDKPSTEIERQYEVSKPILQVKTFWSPLTFSPCHGGRPSSRSSLGSSRLSSSHNSLSVPTAHRADDSSFIMQAVSHDTLTSNQISDLYNVPFDSDVYAIPVDTIRPPIKPKRVMCPKKRRRNTSSGFREIEPQIRQNCTRKLCVETENGKRHSVAGTSENLDQEPIRMTLQEVRQYLQTLYSSSSDSSEQKEYILKPNAVKNDGTFNFDGDVSKDVSHASLRGNKKNVMFSVKPKKLKEEVQTKQPPNKQNKWKKTQNKISSFKQSFCNIFRLKRMSPEEKGGFFPSNCDNLDSDTNRNITNRALPPLPTTQEPSFDFATSIRKVKDCGWYWGPLSGEAAEKILSNEPDGSFIVRDSSDDHYIFSLTLKLNNTVRHVRIEHDQGNFSFGNYTKFKSQTIVEFIENAVEHSRSGRYLFFLNRRPTIGPVRVQLLYPVSRFKQIQSLQHMCRFVINKNVRRDLIQQLPLPRRMIDYLSTPHYYSEMVDGQEEQSDGRRSVTPIRADDHEDNHADANGISNYVLVRSNNNTQRS